MNWFYRTTGQTEGGPVDEATLKAMHRSGEISGDTELRREDSETWIPFAATFSAETPPPLPELQRCAECDQPFPPDQLITLAGRQICATCKPLAIQKFQEGVAVFGDAADPEQLWQKIQQRGFDFTISSVLSRSFDLVKSNYWPAVGVTLLGYFIIMAAGQIPLLGLLSAFLVQPQMMAGIGWYFLRQIRGETATVNDLFAGFRRGFGQQAIYMLIIGLISVVVMIPAFVVLFMMIRQSETQETMDPMMMGIAFAVFLPVMCALWYVMLRWIFTSLLILDKGLQATAAMKLSGRVVHLHFWKIFGLLLVAGLIAMAGMMVLCVGLIFVLPITFAVLSRLYEDAFGEMKPVTAA